MHAIPLLARASAVALFTLAAAGCGWLAWAQWGPLPAPRDAGRADLLRWIVTRDLTHETPALRLDLVDRWQEELQAGLDVASAGDWLSPEQLKQVAKNAELLQGDWFAARCEQYAALAEKERTAFLDQQIATIANWTAVERQVGGEKSSSGGSLFTRIDAWIATAEPTQQTQMQQAVSASLLRWMSTTDLTGQSPAVIQELAERLAARLDAGAVTPDTVPLTATPTERAQLRANALLLCDAWFGRLAGEYVAIEKEGQIAFVDAILDRWEKWNLAAILAESPDVRPTNPLARAAASLEMAATLRNRIDLAPPAEQPQRRKLFDALQSRVIWRQLPDFLKPS